MPYYNGQRNSWTAQVVHDGKKYRTQHQTRSQALQWEEAKKSELSKGVEEHSPQMSTASLYDWAVAYLNHVKERHVPKTYLEKCKAFKEFFRAFDPDMEIAELHRGQVLRHFQEQARIRSGNAANKDRKNLLAAWNWAVHYLPDFPQSNPFDVARCAEVRSPRQVPTEEEFWAVYHAAESDQDKLMLLCYLHLAARRTEIFQLRREDVDLDRKQIMLRTCKRREGSMSCDWLPMSTSLHRAMTEHLSCTSSPWIFANPATGEPYIARPRWIAGLCRKAGVKQFGLHGIRHLSASILVAQQVPLTEVQAVLRHTSVLTTQRYVHRLRTGRCIVSVFQ